MYFQNLNYVMIVKRYCISPLILVSASLFKWQECCCSFIHRHKVQQVRFIFFIGQPYRWKKDTSFQADNSWKILFMLLHVLIYLTNLSYTCSILLSTQQEYKWEAIVTVKNKLTYTYITFRNAPYCFRYFLFQDTPFFSSNFCPN